MLTIKRKIVFFVAFETPNITKLVFITAARPRCLENLVLKPMFGKHRTFCVHVLLGYSLPPTNNTPSTIVSVKRQIKTDGHAMPRRMFWLIFFFFPTPFCGALDPNTRFSTSHDPFRAKLYAYRVLCDSADADTRNSLGSLHNVPRCRGYVFRAHSAAEKSHSISECYGRASGKTFISQSYQCACVRAYRGRNAIFYHWNVW